MEESPDVVEEEPEPDDPDDPDVPEEPDEPEDDDDSLEEPLDVVDEDSLLVVRLSLR